MLNGIDPIIIFHFWKLTPAQEASISKIPIISSIVSKIGLPPIPIYLSERLTGLYISDTEKSVEIETKTDTLSDSATDPLVNQKAIQSTIKINMLASRDSIGMTLISALIDLIVPKVTSKEYSISFLYGATTVFNGLLHSFNISQNAENDLYTVTIELSKTSTKTVEKTGPPEVTPVAEPVTLTEGVAPTAPITTTPLQGPPAQAPSSPPVSMGPLG